MVNTYVKFNSEIYLKITKKIYLINTNILATQYKDSWEVESFECIVNKNNKNDIASLKKSVSCRDSST